MRKEGKGVERRGMGRGPQFKKVVILEFRCLNSVPVFTE